MEGLLDKVTPVILLKYSVGWVNTSSLVNIRIRVEMDRVIVAALGVDQDIRDQDNELAQELSAYHPTIIQRGQYDQRNESNHMRQID